MDPATSRVTSLDSRSAMKRPPLTISILSDHKTRRPAAPDEKRVSRPVRYFDCINGRLPSPRGPPISPGSGFSMVRWADEKGHSSRLSLRYGRAERRHELPHANH